MPCITDYPEDLQERIRYLNDLFCVAMRVVDANGLVDRMPPRVRQEWSKHKQVDLENERRAQREAELARTRAEAKAKLSAEECEALGLDY